MPRPLQPARVEICHRVVDRVERIDRRVQRDLPCAVSVIRSCRSASLQGRQQVSLSRVSRILDGLESRRLVERLADPADTRAKHARLTPAGLDLLRVALKRHLDGVERVFFERLTEEDIETLARVFEAFRR